MLFFKQIPQNLLPVYALRLRFFNKEFKYNVCNELFNLIIYINLLEH